MPLDPAKVLPLVQKSRDALVAQQALLQAQVDDLEFRLKQQGALLDAAKQLLVEVEYAASGNLDSPA